MIKLRNLRKDQMVVVELPASVAAPTTIKRGVIDRSALVGDSASEATAKKPSLIVAKIDAPANLTLLPRGKKGDMSNPLPDTARTAPDVVRKVNLKLIEVVEE